MRLPAFFFCALAFASAALADPLPSWNAGEAKSRLLDFVEATTDPAGPDYVPPEARIAVFDNDGTLWSEQPFYYQLLFAFDYLARRAEDDPGLLDTPMLEAAAAGDAETVLGGGEEALLEVVAASHSGMSVEDFQAAAEAWLATAVHPDTGRPIAEHVFQPMLELLRWLRDEDFQTWIVSGGGVHFLRAFAEDAYGIPPERIIGSVGETEYAEVEGRPVLMKSPGIAFIDDKAGKPVGIDRSIGRRPILAVGNSDGDFEMLAWTTAGEGPRLGMLVHHTDAEREWAYDRESHVGRLDRGLDEGPDRGWVIVDMAEDWNRVWPD